MHAVIPRSRTRVLAVFAAVSFFPIGRGHAAEPQGMPHPLATREIEVIGGSRVNAWESPWQVALISSASSPVQGVFCGGTMVDSQWVLTAAHCLYDPTNCAKIPRQAFYVAYGSTDLGKRVSLMAPAELFHPKEYSCKGKSHDIALIRLQEPISVTTFVRFPSPTEAAKLTSPGVRLMTTGWGLTEVDGWKSRDLLEVEVPIVRLDTCKAHYGEELPQAALCAGEAGKDACTGDSGGPLYKRKVAGVTVQVGVVSFGDSCGKAKIPGVYTPVVEYLAWIEAIRKPKPCTQQDIDEHRC